MRLGLVTYNMAAKWDCDTLIGNCEELGYEGVELRTTHAHGVEPDLSEKERTAIRQKFEDSGVSLVGLGSVFEYHAVDPEELRANVEGTKEFIVLAKDVGAEGIKVRPNALPKGAARERTIEQIGRSLNEVAAFGGEHGVRIRLEVHGRGTGDPEVIRQVMEVADDPNAYVCWNSNMTDLDESGSIDESFRMLKDRIEILHINQLWNEYPWARLFGLLKESGFDGFCLAEIPGSEDAAMVLRYYRKLFQTLVAFA